MGLHYIDIKINGERGLLMGGLNDHEFDQVARHFNGVLPKGMIATHFHKESDVETSPRFAILRTFPMVVHDVPLPDGFLSEQPMTAKYYLRVFHGLQIEPANGR